MSMEDVLDSFWDARLQSEPVQKVGSIYDLIGKRIPFWAARTKDGKAKIVSVIPYNGPFDFIDCVVKLEHFSSNGDVKFTEMSYNSKDYRD
ncbi:MAG TPA: hypothetical protein VFM18_02955 [Methanosarcina sp.]|nr:hypothetical protein [Methanosarcina sp.]